MVSIYYLVNGVDICICGVDIIGYYFVVFGEYGQVDWELLVNFNCIILCKNYRGVNGELLFNVQQVVWIISFILCSQVFFGGIWSCQDWEVSLCLMCYGWISLEFDYMVGLDVWLMEKFNYFVNDLKYIIDIVVCYWFSVDLMLIVGVDNLFDVCLDKLFVQNIIYGDVLCYDIYVLQIGFNGVFYYLCVVYCFQRVRCGVMRIFCDQWWCVVGVGGGDYVWVYWYFVEYFQFVYCIDEC